MPEAFVFKIHSRCNLNCTYCYMYNRGDESYLKQPKRVSGETLDRFIEMILSHHEAAGETDFTILFHGGEPLYVGKPFFAAMMERFESRLGHLNMRYCLQTNATLVDEEWIRLFGKYGINVGASIDGTPKQNARYRLDHQGRDSTPAAIRGISFLQQYPHFRGVISVVQPDADGAETVRFFVEELGLTWFDFLLPDCTYADVDLNWPAKQDAYAKFLCDAFRAWYPWSKTGVGCRLFDSVIAGLAGIPTMVDSVGANGLTAMVIETDGTIETHDALRVCNGVERFTGLYVGPGIFPRIQQSEAYRLANNAGAQNARKCIECSEFDACKGGNYIHRYSAANGFVNPSVHCQALYAFIRHVKQYLGGILLAEAQQEPGREAVW